MFFTDRNKLVEVLLLPSSRRLVGKLEPTKRACGQRFYVFRPNFTAKKNGTMLTAWSCRCLCAGRLFSHPPAFSPPFPRRVPLTLGIGCCTHTWPNQTRRLPNPAADDPAGIAESEAAIKAWHEGRSSETYHGEGDERSSKSSSSSSSSNDCLYGLESGSLASESPWPS